MSQPPSQAAVAAAAECFNFTHAPVWWTESPSYCNETIAHLAAIIDRHIPATDRAGWQEMESAPKDGTHLIGLVTDEGDEENDEPIQRVTEIFHPVGYQWVEIQYSETLPCIPLGWMHKPQPPSAPSPTKV